jgi:hypothetical protein
LEVQSGRALTRAGDDEVALAVGLPGRAHARQAADTAAALQAASLLQTNGVSISSNRTLMRLAHGRDRLDVHTVQAGS